MAQTIRIAAFLLSMACVTSPATWADDRLEGGARPVFLVHYMPSVCLEGGQRRLGLALDDGSLRPGAVGRLGEAADRYHITTRRSDPMTRAIPTCWNITLC